MKKAALSTGIVIVSFLLCITAAFALTTDEMLNLRKCGISEETIVIMVESGYPDAAKVLKLKEAGFKEDNIRAIVKAESRSISRGEEVALQTSARVKIVRYLVFRGNPVLQNDQTIDGVVLSLFRDSKLKLEWKEQAGLGLLDALKRKPLNSPFYWDINPKVDSLTTGADGYAYVLRSGPDHRGKPETDALHYWLLYFDPGNADIIEHIKKSL